MPFKAQIWGDSFKKGVKANPPVQKQHRESTTKISHMNGTIVHALFRQRTWANAIHIDTCILIQPYTNSMAMESKLDVDFPRGNVNL